MDWDLCAVHGLNAVFLIYADRLGLQPNALLGREAFTALSFSHEISDDRQSGAVTLRPDARILQVRTGEYERVRVFGEDGGLVGAMTRSPYGQVSWSAPMWTELNQRQPKMP